MGVVTLQLGQGGIQFGYSFLEALSTLSPTATLPQDFFKEPSSDRLPPLARAVLIDTEPKVIASVRRKTKEEGGSWLYSPRSCFSEEESGSGNNWARGFFKYGPKYHHSILDIIRPQVESCDSFTGFLTMQSIAGGTGSGLGTYVVEMIRDEFPKSSVLSHCIWPFEYGEVTVQSYNVLLSLAHLDDLTDGIIISKNDDLMAICKKALSILSPSFDDMNQVGAQELASVLLPAYWRSSSIQHQKHKNGQTNKHKNAMLAYLGPKIDILSDLIDVLCSHPKYHMLSLRSMPQIPTKSLDYTSFTWDFQLKQLRRMLHIDLPVSASATNSSEEEKRKGGRYESTSGVQRVLDKCLSNVLVLRGHGSVDVDVSLLADESLYVPWFGKSMLAVGANPACLGRNYRWASLLSNCQSAITPASKLLTQAHGLYQARAYLFQYADNGMDESNFQTTFTYIDDLLARYHGLS